MNPARKTIMSDVSCDRRLHQGLQSWLGAGMASAGMRFEPNNPPSTDFASFAAAAPALAFADVSDAQLPVDAGAAGPAWGSPDFPGMLPDARAFWLLPA